MTQEEMNQVIAAAIAFGMNNDMSGELHEVKLNNLGLAEQIQKLSEDNNRLRLCNDANDKLIKELQKQNEEMVYEQRKVASDNCIRLYECYLDRPAHGQLCLCINVPSGEILGPQHLLLAKYNDKAKYWDAPDADVDNDSHDDGLYDYADYKIKYYMPINTDNFVLVTKGNSENA